MPAEILASLSAFKNAIDIARGLKDISDSVARNQAVIDLQQIILDAQRAQQELLAEVSDLRAKLASVDDKRAELAKYERVDVRGSGQFAYKLKDTPSRMPADIVCPTCYESGRVSSLHYGHRSDGQDWYECYYCKKNMSFGQYQSSYSPGRSHAEDF